MSGARTHSARVTLAGFLLQPVALFGALLGLDFMTIRPDGRHYSFTWTVAALVIVCLVAMAVGQVMAGAVRARSMLNPFDRPILVAECERAGWPSWVVSLVRGGWAASLFLAVHYGVSIAVLSAMVHSR